MSNPNTTQEVSGRTMEQQLQKQLADIADKLSETNVAVTKMSGKIDQLETILNMKVDNNKVELERQIREIDKEVEELKRYREKHTDEHRQDANEKNKFTWGLIATAGITILGVIFQIAQKI